MADNNEFEPNSASDHDLLIRIHGYTETQEKRINNHGKRIVSLEQWRWLLTGAIFIVGFLVVNFGKLMKLAGH